MNLPKTVVLPSDEGEGSQRFEEFLDQALALFVVLGDGDQATQLVQLANDFAGDAMDLTRVLWATNPQVVQGSLSNGRLAAGEQSRLPALESDLGFVIFLDDINTSPRIVSDVISPSDSVDETRAVEAWSNGGV